MNGFDLNLLMAFEAIYEERSVTKAAAKLRLTQSATSNTLNRLRVAFDDKLFVPTTKGMAPTPFADKLMADVRTSLSQLRSALQSPPGFDPATSSRIFHLRLTDMGEILFLPRFLRYIQDIAPGIKIRSVRLSLEELQAQLPSGEVDVAIGFLPGVNRGIMQQGLFEDRYICAVRKGHPASDSHLTIEKFRLMSHLIVEPQGSGNRSVHQAYSSHGVPIQNAMAVSHLVSVPHIIAATDMIVAIPERLGLAFSGSSFLTLLEPPISFPKFVVRQHWHERFQNDPASQWLRRCIEYVSKPKDEEEGQNISNSLY